MFLVIKEIFKDHVLKRISLDGSPRHLAFIRIVIAGYLLYLISFDGNLKVLHWLSPENMLPPTIVPYIIESFVWKHWEGVLVLGGTASFFMMIGLFTRTSILISLGIFYLIYNCLFRFTYYHNEWPYFWFPLLVLFFSKSNAVWSIDSLIMNVKKGKVRVLCSSSFRWPLELCIIWYGCIYFFAGYAKVFPISSGISWAKGGTIQWVAMTRYFDSPWYWLVGDAPFPRSKNIFDGNNKILNTKAVRINPGIPVKTNIPK